MTLSLILQVRWEVQLGLNSHVWLLVFVLKWGESIRAYVASHLSNQLDGLLCMVASGQCYEYKVETAEHLKA
jgi:hypothetical protein